VTKELTQMHDMNVFCPIEVESLTYDEKKKVLSEKYGVDVATHRGKVQ
jgi:hypothetical protein